MAVITDEDIQAAVEEVASKPHTDIERETAVKWGARAIASYKAGNIPDAEDYYRESLEHAAMADPTGKLLHDLHVQISEHRGAPTVEASSKTDTLRVARVLIDDILYGNRRAAQPKWVPKDNVTALTAQDIQQLSRQAIIISNECIECGKIIESGQVDEEGYCEACAAKLHRRHAPAEEESR